MPTKTKAKVKKAAKAKPVIVEDEAPVVVERVKPKGARMAPAPVAPAPVADVEPIPMNDRRARKAAGIL